MRYREQYDWVVLGDHPAALLSAALAAKLGMSVLVLPFMQGARTTVSKSGQCLDPEPNFLLSLGHADNQPGLLRQCLEQLDMRPPETERLRQASSVAQILTPSKRISFGRDQDDLSREFLREYGENAEQKLGLPAALARSETTVFSFWKDFLSTLEKIGPGGDKRQLRLREPAGLDLLKRSLKQKASLSPRHERFWFSSSMKLHELKKLDSVREAGEFLSGLCESSMTGDPSQLSLLEVLQTLALSKSGALFRGGMTGYRRMLLALASHHGAAIPEVSENAECSRVFVEDGKITGLQISNEGQMISVRGALLGCSLSHARERIVSSRDRWKRQIKTQPNATAWRFTLALTVHAEAIPPGASERMLWHEEGAPPIGIEIADPMDYGISEPEHRLIFLRTTLPFSQQSLEVDYQRMIGARMLQQLIQVMPFLEYHVVRIYPDFRTENDDFSEVFGYAMPELIPENLRCYTGKGIGYETGIDGLYAASNESYPFLGSLGPTVAAIEATHRIARQSGISASLT